MNETWCLCSPEKQEGVLVKGRADRQTTPSVRPQKTKWTCGDDPLCWKISADIRPFNP